MRCTMKVTRFNNCYAVRVTEYELSVLRKMEEMLSRDDLIENLTTGERRALSRRNSRGSIFRVDYDRRTPYYKAEDRA